MWSWMQGSEPPALLMPSTAASQQKAKAVRRQRLRPKIHCLRVMFAKREVFHVTKSTVCSKCRVKPRRENQRYCVTCHAASMRLSRKTHPLTLSERLKMNCRSYSLVYQKRGKLPKGPCEVCGEQAQNHHPDYKEPLKVRRLC